MSNDKDENSADRMIYACAGVANTGYPADRVARYWMQSGEGRMSCLAALDGPAVTCLHAHILIRS